MRLAIKAVSAPAFAILLSCGGGDDTPTPAPAPTPNTVTLAYDAKQLQFSWGAVPGATHYRLFERATPSEAFVQIGGDLATTSTTHEIPVHLRHEAQYRVESCTNSTCAPIGLVRPAEYLIPAIGYRQDGFRGFEHGDTYGNAVAISADGGTVLVAARLSGADPRPRTGSVQAYTRMVGQLVREACCFAPNLFGGFIAPDTTGDFFGSSVAVSADGTTVAIGATGRPANDQTPPTATFDPRNAGAVYVFVKANGIWTLHAYLRASNVQDGDRFGTSVALSGDGNTLAVGAPYEASSARGINGDQADNTAFGAGAVYVFARTGNVWTQQAYVKASNAEQNDEFGGAVALSGDGNTLAVGAVGEDSRSVGLNGNEADNSANGAGAAYLFFRTAGNWTQQAYVKASNAEANDAFGITVSLSSDGNTLAVGASREASSSAGVNGNQADDMSPGAGAVYLFGRSSGVWAQQAYVKASTPNVNDEFGSALALSADGNVLAVGAPREQSLARGVGGDELDNSTFNTGAAYVFTRTNSQWAQRSYVKASNTARDDFFGDAIALSGDGKVLLVGAPAKDSGAGAAYLY